jgi:hypothetical protein
MLSVVFAEVFDFGGGVFVVDLSVLVAGTTIEAWILWSFAHVSSIIVEAGLSLEGRLSRGIVGQSAFRREANVVGFRR